jgi:hypothetical protein
VVLRSTLAALERIPPDTRKRAWRVLEDAVGLVPRSIFTAPLGGRLPLVRPTISPDRLAGAVSGRRILLTGATSGIGLETAYAISRAGGTLTLGAMTRRSSPSARAAQGARSRSGCHGAPGTRARCACSACRSSSPATRCPRRCNTARSWRSAW